MVGDGGCVGLGYLAGTWGVGCGLCGWGVVGGGVGVGWCGCGFCLGCSLSLLACGVGVVSVSRLWGCWGQWSRGLLGVVG